MARRQVVSASPYSQQQGAASSDSYDNFRTEISLLARIRRRGGLWGVRVLRLALAGLDSNQDGFVTVEQAAAALSKYGLGHVDVKELVGVIRYLATPQWQRRPLHGSNDVVPMVHPVPNANSTARNATAAAAASSSASPNVANDPSSFTYPAISIRRGKPPGKGTLTAQPVGSPSEFQLWDEFNLCDFMDHVTHAFTLTHERFRIIQLAFRTMLKRCTPHSRAVSTRTEKLLQQQQGMQAVREEKSGGRPQGSIVLEDLLFAMNIEAHPYVQSSAYTVRETLFVLFGMWGLRETKDLVTEPIFCQYFLDMSVNFYNDRQFETFLRGLLGMSTDDEKQQDVLPVLVPNQQESDKVFDSIDVNGNGTLSLAELDLAVLSLWPALNHKPSIMRAYKLADASGNGWLDKAEFYKFLHYLVAYNDLRLKFQAIDTDRSGSITLDELKKGKKKIGLAHENDVTLRRIFKEIDTNNGGKILFEEFCIHMAKKQGDEMMSRKTNEW